MDNHRLRAGSFGSDRLGSLARMDAEGGLEERLSPLLLPHPDDDTDDDAPSPRLVGGREYVRQNLFMVSLAAKDRPFSLPRRALLLRARRPATPC